MKDIVIVRSTRIDARAVELASQVSERYPDYQIFVITDQLEGRAVDVKIQALIPRAHEIPLTREFVSDAGLFFEQGRRIAWRCGDYAVYATLGELWDRAWVIDSDVYFLNNSLDIFEEHSSDNSALLCTHFWKATSGWVPYKALRTLNPEIDIYTMAFPLFRISREAALAALDLRRNFTRSLEVNSGFEVPNDESVVASSVVREFGSAGVSALDVSDAEMFKYWSTITRFPIDDMTGYLTGSFIVHSGSQRSKFLSQMLFYWQGARGGSAFHRKQLLESLSFASKDTWISFLNKVLDDES